MGIPKFFRYLSRSPIFSGSIRKKLPETNIFAIDLNGILHPIFQKFFNPTDKKLKISRKIGDEWVIPKELFEARKKEAFEDVIYNIVKLTEIVSPSEMLIIAVDGIAPQSKINQQRKRRFISASSKEDDTVFDSNSITPGTDFMFELDKYLGPELEKLSKDSKLPQTIIYSSHLVPGEGEHKIAEYLKNIADSEKKNVVIYGMDADLILIYSLLFVKNNEYKYNEIYLFRNNNEYFEIEKTINLKFIIDVLKKLYSSAKNPIDDFSFLLTCIGNDFLPRFPSFERIDNALDTLIYGYYDFLKLYPNKYLIEQTIIWKNVYEFLNYINKKYNTILLRAWAINDPETIAVQHPITNLAMIQENDLLVLDLAKFHPLWYKYVYVPSQKYDIKIYESDIDDMCANYLEGLSWVYNYYKYGINSINPRWFYKYHYSPLFSDLVDYLSKSDLDQPKWYDNSIINKDFYPTIPEQLLMVIPPSSINILPYEIRPLYTEKSPIYDYFPEGFVLDLNGKGDVHNGVALIPIPDPLRIKNSLQFLNVNEMFFQKYENIEPLIIFSEQNIYNQKTYRQIQRPYQRPYQRQHQTHYQDRSQIPYQQTQRPYQQQQIHYQPSQRPYQQQQRPYQQSQSHYQPSQRAYQQSQRPYQPSQSHYQPSQRPYQPSQRPYQPSQRPYHQSQRPSQFQQIHYHQSQRPSQYQQIPYQ